MESNASTLSIQNFMKAKILQDFIDSSTNHFISVIILQQCVKVSLRIFGIITNFISLILFWKCKLDDGITICFFALTVSDLICLASYLVATWLGYLDMNMGIKPNISLYWIAYIIPFYGIQFSNTSSLITLFLSVQKCCCVAMPFQFKNTFSKTRCTCVIMLINCVMLVTYIPFTVSVFPFQSVTDTSTNTTRLVLIWSSFHLNQILPMVKIVSFILIPITSEIVVLFCTILIAVKLRESARFRKITVARNVNANFINIIENKNTSPTLPKIPSYETRNKCRKRTASTEDAAADKIFNKFKSTSTIDCQTFQSERDFRATLAVNVVAAIFVISNSPDIVLYLMSLIFPDFTGTGLFRNTYKLCLEIQDLLHVLHMSTNMFIYLKFNSRYLVPEWSLILSSQTGLSPENLVPLIISIWRNNLYNMGFPLITFTHQKLRFAVPQNQETM
ncbi:hypothetical protein Btru_022819 [Bulinus truncatus]|nr:hypothetical protein Btru_022819 [Bulinus truncatus]